MWDKIGGWAIIVLLLGIVGGLCYALSYLYYGLIESGPQIVLEVTIVATATVTAANWGMGYMALETTELVGRPRLWGLVFGLVVGAACTWIPATLLWDGHGAKVYLETYAPQARDFALQHFDELDRDHTGIITDGNLGADEADPRFSATERALIDLLKTQIDLAGHVIDSYTVQVPITTYISCGQNCSIPVTNYVPSTTYVYGISRGDLPEFPAREHEKWQNW